MKITKEIFEIKLNDEVRKYQIGIEFGNYASTNLLLPNRKKIITFSFHTT